MQRSQLLITLVLLGCGVDSTAIPNPFNLVIAGPTAQEGSVSIGGARLCDLELTALAQGGEDGAYATWLGLEVRRFDYGLGRWMETINYGEEGIADFWGSDRLDSGTSITRTSYWEHPDGNTFQLIMTFYYQTWPTVQQRTASHTFDCN